MAMNSQSYRGLSLAVEQIVVLHYKPVIPELANNQGTVEMRSRKPSLVPILPAGTCNTALVKRSRRASVHCTLLLEVSAVVRAFQSLFILQEHMS